MVLLQLFQLRRHQAIAINVNSQELRTDQRQGRCDSRIAGIFNRRQIVWIEQQLRAHEQGLLRPGGDDDLIRIAHQSPCIAQITRQQATQLRITGRIAIADVMRWRMTPEISLQACPY